MLRKSCIASLTAHACACGVALALFAGGTATAAESLSAPQLPVITVALSHETLPDELRSNERVLAFAAAAEQLCRDHFVNVQQLLFPDDPLPEELSVRIKLIMQEDGIAWAGGGEITANLKWFLDRPEDVGAIYHELVHIVQAYPHNDDSGWLVEGIADWARYFVYEDRRLESYADKGPGHYRDAYTNAARFLEWLRLNKNADCVVQLNRRLRAGSYNPATDWPDLCAAGLDALWDEYVAAISQASRGPSAP